jgi:hypothetical protein
MQHGRRACLPSGRESLAGTWTRAQPEAQSSSCPKRPPTSCCSCPCFCPWRWRWRGDVNHLLRRRSLACRAGDRGTDGRRCACNRRASRHTGSRTEGTRSCRRDGTGGTFAPCACTGPRRGKGARTRRACVDQRRAGEASCPARTGAPVAWPRTRSPRRGSGCTCRTVPHGTCPRTCAPRTRVASRRAPSMAGRTLPRGSTVAGMRAARSCASRRTGGRRSAALSRSPPHDPRMTTMPMAGMPVRARS